MIVRIKTPTGTKQKVFDNLEVGNAWAKQVYKVLGREREFLPTKLARGTHTISSFLTILELHDEGVSFFGATDV